MLFRATCSESNLQAAAAASDDAKHGKLAPPDASALQKDLQDLRTQQAKCVPPLPRRLGSQGPARTAAGAP